MSPAATAASRSPLARSTSRDERDQQSVGRHDRRLTDTGDVRDEIRQQEAEVVVRSGLVHSVSSVARRSVACRPADVPPRTGRRARTPRRAGVPAARRRGRLPCPRRVWGAAGQPGRRHRLVLAAGLGREWWWRRAGRLTCRGRTRRVRTRRVRTSPGSDGATTPGRTAAGATGGSGGRATIPSGCRCPR